MNYRKSEAKEAAKSQFHGIWTAITTPFTPDFELDEAGLRSNMKRVADLKIEGVFCTGVMGEFWSLTKEERKRIVEIVVEEAHRRNVKVIAHTAHHSAHETVELTRHAEDVGADFAILMNPYYPPPSEQTIYGGIISSSRPAWGSASGCSTRSSRATVSPPSSPRASRTSRTSAASRSRGRSTTMRRCTSSAATRS